MFLLTSNTDACDEDVGESVVQEELTDKPGTTNDSLLDILQSILLPFFGEMWFLTAGPVVGIPMTFAEFPRVKELREFLQEA